MRFQFIADHCEQFEVTVMCRVLEVSRSGYYAWRKRPTSEREMADQALTEQIKVIYGKSQGTYGSPRIQAELAAEGVKVSRKRVARLMRQADLRGDDQGQTFKVVTTDANHDYPVAPNLLAQTFEAERPDQLWLADITYIPTDEGWLYLAALLDMYSRRIVGWALSDSLHRQLVIDALQMALVTRQPAPGLTHHSDRGSQYASDDYQALLTKHQIVASMSRAGNCYDNAPMESFFASLKTERVHHRHYPTRAAARTDIFDYIEAFYNRFRRHSALDYLNPVAFEQLAFLS
jgi:putative transposase